MIYDIVCYYMILYSIISDATAAGDVTSKHNNVYIIVISLIIYILNIAIIKTI